MSRIICLALFGIMVFRCHAQHAISGLIPVPDAIFRYTAEGRGIPLVIFTGGENIGHKVFPKELKNHFTLIHADPSQIDAEAINTITLDDILDDLEKLRVAIGVEKMGILGHSMFGQLPLELPLNIRIRSPLPYRRDQCPTVMR